MDKRTDLFAHDLPPDPIVPPGDQPPPPPPAPDIKPPPMREPPFEHPTPIREPSRSPGPMSAPVRTVSIVCDAADAEALRLAEATRTVFDAAGIEVDMAALPDAHAVLAIVSPSAALALADAIATQVGGQAIGRAYALVVTGDPDRAEPARRRLSDALDDMGLIDAIAQARLDRFLDYELACDTCHGSWYADEPARETALNAARDLVNAVVEIRAGRLDRPDLLLARPRLPA